jgi:hypothetical protein
MEELLPGELGRAGNGKAIAAVNEGTSYRAY